MSALSDLATHRSFSELNHAQHGVVTHAQMLALGLTSSQARRWVRSGRWQRMHQGVYATFTGPVPPPAIVWAAVLSSGRDAAASHETALWLAGVEDQLRRPLRVVVPHDRQVRPDAGVRVTRARTQALLLGAPPRVTVESAVLDVCAERSEGDVVDLVLRAVQRRRTTPERLRVELAGRARHRWRRLIAELVQESAAGVASVLERRYLRHVERPHGLPAGTRNRPEQRSDRRGVEYRDVRYRSWGFLVELDGRVAHPWDEQFRDMDRDNRSAIESESVLHYGWHDVVGRPCHVAGQVVTMLRRRGWTGNPTACGPGCRLATSSGSFTVAG